MPANPFDEKAATWDDDPAKVERANRLAAVIRKRVPLDPSTRLLDYGAGTGLVTQALRDAVGPVTMADTSAGMRSVMEAKVAAGAIAGGRVWDLDLAGPDVPDERFDVIVTVLTLHHIADLAPVLANMHRLLAPGGRLCVVDLEAEDGSFHGADFDGHQGFEQAALTAQLEAAGLGQVTYERCHELVRDGHAYPLFLAIGVRPG